MDRLKYLFYQPMSSTVRDFSDTPIRYLTHEIELVEPWAVEAVTRKLLEHKRDVYGIEPAGILLDPKTAVQLGWELGDGRNFNGRVSSFQGIPVFLVPGTKRIELVFNDRAFSWLLSKDAKIVAETE